VDAILATLRRQAELRVGRADVAMTGGDVPGEFGAFLDVHWMILTDPTLAETPKRIIAEQRCNAEWALAQQTAVLIEQFDAIDACLVELLQLAQHTVEFGIKGQHHVWQTTRTDVSTQPSSD
jgi:phosphoenolpyruvate-protein kinase (PTS system EI component)